MAGDTLTVYLYYYLPVLTPEPRYYLLKEASGSSEIQKLAERCILDEKGLRVGLEVLLRENYTIEIRLSEGTDDPEIFSLYTSLKEGLMLDEDPIVKLSLVYTPKTLGDFTAAIKSLSYLLDTDPDISTPFSIIATAERHGPINPRSLTELKLMHYITIKGKKYSADSTELKLSFEDLKNDDIVDLSWMRNLGALYLRGNQISDLTPLARLKKLVYLDLRDNPISDWSPVAHVLKVLGRPIDTPLTGSSVFGNR